MIYDLHSHTTASDGALSPGDLLSRALENHVDVLAITDHDTVDAHLQSPSLRGIELVSGIEFSTRWENRGIHILGLNFELDSEAIRTGVDFQSEARLERARQIAGNLEKKGIQGAFSGAREFSGSHYIGRPHFARYLVESGRVRSIQDAFKQYLGDGKVGDVRQNWADLPQIIEWIRDANGVAVLAHPLKYKLTRTKLKKLLESFKQAGGRGMEVVSGQQTLQHTSGMAQLCREMNLLASCGSDFHMPDQRWAELGKFSPLPGDLTPVWSEF